MPYDQYPSAPPDILTFMKKSNIADPYSVLLNFLRGAIRTEKGTAARSPHSILAPTPYINTTQPAKPATTHHDHRPGPALPATNKKLIRHMNNSAERWIDLRILTLLARVRNIVQVKGATQNSGRNSFISASSRLAQRSLAQGGIDRNLTTTNRRIY